MDATRRSADVAEPSRVGWVVNGRSPFLDVAWIAGHLDDVVLRTWQHVQLLIVPMLAGFAISLVLAIIALRRPGTVGPVTAVTGLLYTIPSLAAFAVLRPILGLSIWTAIIPLDDVHAADPLSQHRGGLPLRPARRPRGRRGHGLHAGRPPAGTSSCRSPCRSS